MNDDEVEHGLRLNRVLGDCLICISGKYVPVDDRDSATAPECSFSATAFAMSFDGHPVLITAGHVIDELLDPMFIENKFEGQRVRITGCFICDFFGTNPRVRKPTPFDYAGCLRFSMDKQSLVRKSLGLDFGLILMSDWWWTGLRGNGIKPLGEERWVVQKNASFDAYRMVGFPFNEVNARRGDVQQVSYNITKSTDPDVPAPDGEPAWFVGTLPPGVKSVLGVSGGPIFGFRKLGENLWHYEVVAVQGFAT